MSLNSTAVMSIDGYEIELENGDTTDDVCEKINAADIAWLAWNENGQVGLRFIGEKTTIEFHELNFTKKEKGE